MINELKYQIKNDLYEIYSKIYDPVYRIKEKINILCGGDYNTLVFTFEKIGNENQIITRMDNSFIGFCKDILLNPSFDYFLSFKYSDELKERYLEEISFRDIWKTLGRYNICKDIKDNFSSTINYKHFIELKNFKCINVRTNDSPEHFKIPSFINLHSFIQGIKMGNSNCYTFICEFKEVFCVIQCIGS